MNVIVWRRKSEETSERQGVRSVNTQERQIVCCFLCVHTHLVNISALHIWLRLIAAQRAGEVCKIFMPSNLLSFFQHRELTSSLKALLFSSLVRLASTEKTPMSNLATSKPYFLKFIYFLNLHSAYDVHRLISKLGFSATKIGSVLKLKCCLPGNKNQWLVTMTTWSSSWIC